VDDLLAACPEHGLQLGWQAGCCRVRSLGSNGEVVLDVPLRKSIFRAILARVAAVGNERAASSVSPYGGGTEITASGTTAPRFQATFTNTTSEQKLVLMPLR
jgi:hypothetical protein